MKKLLFALALLAAVGASAGTRPTHVYLIGDSTCADKDLEKQNPERGWGQLFRAFFDGEVVVENHAKNGRSTKSFRNEGRWTPICDSLRAGDYVFIQFGHNDEKVHRETVGSVPELFAENLRRYVRETRERGATPVLLTPIARRHFDEKGELLKTHGEYPDRVREVARTEGVTLLEMEPLTEAWLRELGDEASRAYFMWVAKGTSPRYPDGREDNTHLNVRGAHIVSRMVAREVEKQLPELAAHLRIADLVVAQDGSGDFFTLTEAIAAVPDFNPAATIRLSEGVYREKIAIPQTKRNVRLYGVGRAVVTWDDYASKKNLLGRNVGTSGSSTVYFGADGWTVENVTFENAAGRVGQAVAVQTLASNLRFIRCRFLGNQDTLYLYGKGNREGQAPTDNTWVRFEDCYIEGTTDFIFGAASALFTRCEIRSKSDSYITAASTWEGLPCGLTFVDCRLTADEGVTKCYLGRPWRNHAQTVFIRCELGAHIRPEGWHDWSKPEARETAFYGEYGSKGPGAVKHGRAAWSHRLTKQQAEALLEHYENQK